MEKILHPKEMPSFLNELAAKTEDPETGQKLAMCSLFILVCLETIGKNENRNNN